MTMYDFNNGAVVLDFTEGEYKIFLSGSEIDRELDIEQKSNPMLAVSDYIGYIHSYLRQRAKKYLYNKHHNTVMGCTVKDGKCIECQMSGASTIGTHCMFGAGFTGTPLGRVDHGKDNSN